MIIHSYPVDIDAVVRMVRANGPVTAREVQFAFTWDSEWFAREVLRAAEATTDALYEIAGYWTATVTDERF